MQSHARSAFSQSAGCILWLAAGAIVALPLILVCQFLFGIFLHLFSQRDAAALRGDVEFLWYGVLLLWPYWLAAIVLALVGFALFVRGAPAGLADAASSSRESAEYDY